MNLTFFWFFWHKIYSELRFIQVINAFLYSFLLIRFMRDVSLCVESMKMKQLWTGLDWVVKTRRRLNAYSIKPLWDIFNDLTQNEYIIITAILQLSKNSTQLTTTQSLLLSNNLEIWQYKQIYHSLEDSIVSSQV